MDILIPIGIVLGLIAAVYYLYRRIKSADKNMGVQMENLVETIGTIDLARFPKLAERFRGYVLEVFGADLSAMTFRKHAKYVGTQLKKLGKHASEAYFPQGEAEFTAAVMADLGELIAIRYNAHWERSKDVPFFPFLLIELPDGKKTFCSPGAVVIQQIGNDSAGGSGDFISGMILQFEDADAVQQEISQITDSYCVTQNRIELELNQKLLAGIKHSRWAFYGMLLFFTVGPILLFIAEPNRKGLALLTLSGIVILILIGVFIKDRWMMYRLERYERLILEPDHFRLEGAQTAWSCFYSEITFCRIGQKASGLTIGPDIAEFLEIKTGRKRLILLENYFLNHNAAKEVFAEIAQRVTAAKGEGPKP